MKIVIFVVLVVGIVLGGGLALFPMSIAADFARNHVPDLHYGEASGSVWNGKLTNVSFGQQKIGDLSIKANFGELLSGKAGARLALNREGFAGEGGLAYVLGGNAITLSGLKLSGRTAMVPGLPPAVAAVDGKFALEIKELKFLNGGCESAAGEVWTDALAKTAIEGWIGPELRGPVTCAGGKLVVAANGKAATGEAVLAQIEISPHLNLDLAATVTNPQTTSLNALNRLGFKPEGDRYVLHGAIGSP